MSRGEWYATGTLAAVTGPADENYNGVMDDSAATTPAGGLGLSVSQSYYGYYAAPDDDFIICEYEITNNSGDTLTDLYFGENANFRMNDYTFDDYFDYSAAMKMCYSYDATSTVTGGVKYIGHAWNGAPMFPEDPTSLNFAEDWGDDSGMYVAMANGEIDTGPFAAQDGHCITSTGPYNMPAGSTLKIAFAVVMGDDLADMEANAGTAIDTYLANNSSAVINFDSYPYTFADIPSGELLDDLWAGWGVKIDGESMNSGYEGSYAGRPTDHDDVVDNIPVSGLNFCKTREYADDVTSDAGLLTFTFEDPAARCVKRTADYVSIWFLDVEDPGTQLEVFDINDVSLGVVTVPPGEDGNQYFVEIAVPGIYKVVCTCGVPDPDGESVSVDDFSYNLEPESKRTLQEAPRQMQGMLFGGDNIRGDCFR
jgi:hypothetical protein